MKPCLFEYSFSSFYKLIQGSSSLSCCMNSVNYASNVCTVLSDVLYD